MANPSVDPQTLRLVCICAFASMASMRACDAMLPGLATTFAATTGEAAQTISGFALAYGLSQLVYGPLGDRFGKLRVMAVATLACTLGTAAAALASSLSGLIASRVLNGAAAAGIIPLAMAWIGDQVPLAERQEVLARLLGATVTGMVIGQWGGGLVADAGWWRAAFGVLCMVFLFSGAALMRAGVACPVAPSTSTRRTAYGFNQVLAQPWARVLLCVTFIEGALAFGALAFIATHLHIRHGLAMSASGAVVALYGVGGLAYSRNARRLLTHFSAAQLALLGSGSLAVSLAVVACAPSWPWTLPACLVAGFGFYALHNTLQTHATQMAPAARGTAMASFACVLFLGQSAGVTATAWFVDRTSTSPVLLAAAIGLLILGAAFAHLIERRPDALRGSP
jgi:YNFM family putative membrane transporter